jgi:hypothetical protein
MGLLRLGGLRRDRVGGSLDLHLELRRLAPRDLHLALESLQLLRDVRVLAVDGLDVVHGRDEVVEARRAEEEPDVVGLVGLVERDDAALEPALGDPVVAGQPVQVVRLDGELLLDAREARPRRLELRLEGGELHGKGVDRALERVDVVARRRDLRREDAFLLLLGGDLRAERRDLAVEILGRCRGYARGKAGAERKRDEDGCPAREGHGWGFAGRRVLPAPPAGVKATQIL